MGTPQQLAETAYQATRFYDKLRTVPGLACRGRRDWLLTRAKVLVDRLMRTSAMASTMGAVAPRFRMGPVAVAATAVAALGLGLLVTFLFHQSLDDASKWAGVLGTLFAYVALVCSGVLWLTRRADRRHGAGSADSDAPIRSSTQTGVISRRGESVRIRPIWLAVAIAALLAVLVAWQAINVLAPRHSGQGPTSPSASKSDGQARSLLIDKTIWYGGYRVTFGTATYDQAAQTPLTITLKVEHLGRTDRGLREFELPISVAFAGAPAEGAFPGSIVTVGAGSTVDAMVVFDLQQPVPDLASGTITVGSNDVLKAIVPLGPHGDLVTLQPTQVLADTAVTVQNLRFTHLSCQLRPDEIVVPDEVRKGNVALGCTFDVIYRGTEVNIGLFAENFRLIMPNGDLRAPKHPPIELVGKDTTVAGVRVVFVVPWPAPGQYQLRLLDRDRYSNAVLGTADLPLAMPAA